MSCLFTFISAVISDQEVQLHFDEFFEEIFVEMEDKVTLMPQRQRISLSKVCYAAIMQRVACRV